MKNRCKNPERPNYSGRNIKCLWNSFEEFQKDMYKSYQLHCKKFGQKNTSLERIDNNGNYCKENCRWATRKEQGNNKTNNVLFEFKGKKYSLIDLSKKTNITVGRLTYGIYIKKLSIEKVLLRYS